MRVLYVLCLLGLCACGAAGGGAGSNLSQNPQDPVTPTNLYVYGDQESSTAASYAQNLATQQGWNLINRAVAGSSITSATQYNALMTDTWEANAVIFWDFGNNEAAVSGATNAAYKADITAVNSRLISLNQHAILGGPSPYCNDVGHTALNTNVSNFWTNNVYTAWNAADPGLGSHILVYFRVGSGDLGVGAFTPTISNTNADCMTPNSTGIPETLTDVLANWQYDYTSSGDQLWFY